MAEIRILTNEDVKKVLTMSDTVRLVASAYKQKVDGNGCTFPLVFHAFENKNADMDIKSGALSANNVFGLKLVSWFGNNAEKGLPELFGTNLICDMNTGAPKALMNGGFITDMRTGAAAAVGAQILARKNARVLTLAGMGVLAPYVVAAMVCGIRTLETICLVNPHHPDGMEVRGEGIISRAKEILQVDDIDIKCEIKICSNLEEAVRAADILVTATPSYEGFIERQWVKAGTHISCLGADLTGKQELCTEILKDARVYADDLTQSVSVGETELAVKSGAIRKEDICEIGQVLTGEKQGRINEEEITVFDSTGIALQDLIVSSLVLSKAEEKKVGQMCRL